MPWTFCPECDTRIQVPRSIQLQDQLECPECARLLEVIGLQPLELDLAYEPNQEYEGEWEWEEEDDEDDLDYDEFPEDADHL